MTIPFRLRLATAVTDAIKTVTPANGYQHDLSDFDRDSNNVLVPRVYRGRLWFGDSDPIPMVSVLEGVNPADEVFAPVVDMTTGGYNWHLMIQGFVNDDPQNPTDPAYYLERDVRRALMAEKRRLKPGRHTTDPFGVSTWGLPNCAVLNMTLGVPVIRPADDVSAKAYFWTSLTLEIVEDLEAP